MTSGPDIIDSGSGTWWRAGESRRPAPPAGPRDAIRLDEPRGDPVSEPVTGEGGGGPTGSDQEPDRVVAWRRTVALVVVALVAGAIAGAVVDDRFDVARTEATANSVADVDLDDEAVLGRDDDPVTPRFGYQLSVRNLGPRPIDITAANLVGEPFTMIPLDEPVTVPAGERASVELTGTIDCGTVDDGGSPPTRIVLTVRTADGVDHRLDIGGESSRPRRELLEGCRSDDVLDVSVASIELRRDHVVARLTLEYNRANRIRIESVEATDGAFEVQSEGLPLLLSGASEGRVLATFIVAECRQALNFDPTQSQLVLRLSGGPRLTASLDVPPALGFALVRLSERRCR